MTENVAETNANATQQDVREINFRKQEQMFQRQLEAERQRAAELEKRLQEREQARHVDEDDDDDEPYVDKKKLEKKLARFGEQTEKKTKSEIQQAVQQALADERKQNWIKQNGDFYEVLEKHAEELAMRDPELAETILSMPNTFERQKLVYRNIKSMGLDKPRQAEPTIQQKIDANRRSPYYQPSNVGTAPYAPQGDFSQQGKKAAYDKLQQLKANLRLG